MKHVDSIISAKWILPIVPEDTILEDCSLVIHEGRIETIAPTPGIDQKFSTNNHIKLKNQLIMPGLVNAHGHAAMSLMRGMADDLPLMTWLQDHIWPTESRWVDPLFVEDGTNLAIAEMLLTGTTCFSDMYFFPDVAARIAKQTGIRAQIAFPVLDFPTPWAADPDEYIHKGLQLHDDYHCADRISIAFGPHAPYTVSDEPLRRIATLANELQIPIQIHVHETHDEITQSIKDYGARPLKRLLDLGVLSPSTQCVHVTQVNEEDIECLAQSRAKVIHCPESNLKLASGGCPTNRLSNAGITIGLGTDGAASNNDLDMFGEITSAAYLAKFVSNDASVGSAQAVLNMATMGSATALGLEHSIGSLEAGKYADVIAINLDHISCHPLTNIQSSLVYNNRKIRITHSWVEGRLLVENETLVTMNETDIKSKAAHWKDIFAGESK